MSAPGPKEAAGVFWCDFAEQRWKGLGHFGWSATDPTWGKTTSHNSLGTDGSFGIVDATKESCDQIESHENK